jgi:hypothetical protein
MFGRYLPCAPARPPARSRLAVRFAVGITVAFVLAPPATGRGQSGRSERQASLALCKDKRPEGATQLQRIYERDKDAEELFDLALCQEALGQDREAVSSYRAYLKLPLALRIRDAKAHIAAIEEKATPKASPTKMPGSPRHVFLPQARESDACVASCKGPQLCLGLDQSTSEDRAPADRGRRMLKQQSNLEALNKCFTKEFLCLANCPGARVDKGDCPDGEATRGLRCIQDRTSHIAPGVLTPMYF